MQVTIFVKEEDLNELHSFLSAPVKYEHRINFWNYQPSPKATPTVQVQLFYDDYVILNDCVMTDTKHPYLDKENMEPPVSPV